MIILQGYKEIDKQALGETEREREREREAEKQKETVIERDRVS